MPAKIRRRDGDGAAVAQRIARVSVGDDASVFYRRRPPVDLVVLHHKLDALAELETGRIFAGSVIDDEVRLFGYRHRVADIVKTDDFLDRLTVDNNAA